MLTDENMSAAYRDNVNINQMNVIINLKKYFLFSLLLFN